MTINTSYNRLYTNKINRDKKYVMKKGLFETYQCVLYLLRFICILKFPGLIIAWETHIWVCLFWCFQRGLTKDRSYDLSACSFYHPLGWSSGMEIKENRSPPNTSIYLYLLPDLIVWQAVSYHHHHTNDGLHLLNHESQETILSLSHDNKRT